MSAITTPATAGSMATVTATCRGTATTFTANAVLVTVPLGVLKTGSIRFSPSLPTAKQTAISRLGVGYDATVVACVVAVAASVEAAVDVCVPCRHAVS